MKRPAAVLALAVLLAASARAQAPQADFNALLKDGQRWLEQNVDTNVLRSLPELDEKQAKQLLETFQERFQGRYVIDLVKLRGVARLALPLIERDEALRPYGPWLRSRLDYFEAAKELDLVIPPPVKAVPGQPAPKRPAPTQQQQRRVWTRVLATEPWPASANRYVPALKPVFASERVPRELVWLAEVESSFDPGAKSPAGAAGLYQLMPETAKAEGLSLFPSDQRHDPEKSARASARYLRKLHGKFGDWPLTLAAYNAGETRVRTLLTKHKATSFGAIAPYLPAETQMYVPKFEAVLLRREGKALARL